MQKELPLLRRETLSLYRSCIRSCKTFPFVPLRPKLLHNVREMFEITRCRKLQSEEQVSKYLQQGHNDLYVLNKLATLDEYPFKVLFERYTGTKEEWTLEQEQKKEGAT